MQEIESHNILGPLYWAGSAHCKICILTLCRKEEKTNSWACQQRSTDWAPSGFFSHCIAESRLYRTCVHSLLHSLQVFQPSSSWWDDLPGRLRTSHGFICSWPLQAARESEAGRRHAQKPTYFSHENGMCLFICLCLVELFIQQEWNDDKLPTSQMPSLTHVCSALLAGQAQSQMTEHRTRTKEYGFT